MARGRWSRFGRQERGRGRVRRVVGGLLALSVVAALAPAVAAEEPLTAWSPGAPCPDAIVLGAAGSGQRQTPSELGMGRQVDGLARTLAEVGIGLEVAVAPLDYPAAPVLPITGYLASVEAGLEALPVAVGEIATACPGTSIVLAGYSQGAQVVQRALEGIRDPAVGGGDHADRVRAVVLLASPLFTRQAAATQVGTFDPALSGLLGGADVPTWIDQDTVTWCLSGDQVCQAGGLVDWLAFAAASGSVHGSYDDPATLRLLASLVLGRLDATPAAPPAAEPGPPTPGTAAADASVRPLGPAVASSLTTNAVLAAQVTTPVPGDANGSVHREAIARVLAREVMSGYADGTFGPSRGLTRGQAATVLANAFELPPALEPAVFTDTAGSVHATAIAAAAEAGLVSGYPDGTFRPGLPVTRAQFATMLAGGLGLREPYDPTWAAFDDVRPGNVHRAAIQPLTRLGLVAGVADEASRAGAPSRTFAPGLPVTRGQAAALVARSVLQRVASDPDRFLVGVWERWEEGAWCTTTLVAPSPYDADALAVRRVEDGGATEVTLAGADGTRTTTCTVPVAGEVPPVTVEVWVRAEGLPVDPGTWASAAPPATLVTWLRRDAG